MSLKLIHSVQIIIADIGAISAPVIIKLFVTSAKQIQQVICKQAGGSKHGVVYFIMLNIMKVLRKQQGVGTFTVYVQTINEIVFIDVVTILQISVEAITIGHRVTDGYVVDRTNVLMVVLFVRLNGQSEGTNDHGQGKNQGQSLD